MRALGLIFLIVLVSCGPAAKLRRAQRLIERAKAQGAIVAADTVYKEIKVISPPDSITTTVEISKDTIIYQDRIRIEYRPDTTKGKPGPRRAAIKVVCPPDTIKIKVPVYVTNTIHAPAKPSFWKYLALALGVVMIILLILRR